MAGEAQAGAGAAGGAPGPAGGSGWVWAQRDPHSTASGGSPLDLSGEELPLGCGSARAGCHRVPGWVPVRGETRWASGNGVGTWRTFCLARGL